MALPLTQLVAFTFMKFQSIGNDFIIADLHRYHKNDAEILQEKLTDPRTVRSLCARHTGVGADCLLIIPRSYDNNKVDLLVYNADGSQARNCLNGVRTVAHYLNAFGSFDSDITICIGGLNLQCNVSKVYPEEKKADVTTQVPKSNVLARLAVTVDGKKIEGWSASVGNPHFVVLQEGDRSWLELHGERFQKLSAFPEGVNVEFVKTINEHHYEVLVYERGCGITKGCSSGLAAVTRVLRDNGKLEINQKITLSMEGGDVVVWVDENNFIFLQAPSHFVFKGSF